MCASLSPATSGYRPIQPPPPWSLCRCCAPLQSHVDTDDHSSDLAPAFPQCPSNAAVESKSWWASPLSIPQMLSLCSHSALRRLPHLPRYRDGRNQPAATTPSAMGTLPYFCSGLPARVAGPVGCAWLVLTQCTVALLIFPSDSIWIKFNWVWTSK
jgi:hypothetical protein